MSSSGDDQGLHLECIGCNWLKVQLAQLQHDNPGSAIGFISTPNIRISKVYYENLH